MRVNRTQTATALPVSLYKVTSAWGQGNSGSGVDGGGQGEAAQTNDATWNMRLYPGTAWTTPGGDFVATASAVSNVGAQNTSPAWTSNQMTTDVQNWVGNPSTNFGWLLKSTETGAKNTKRFFSQEGPTVAQRPTLTVTYTAGALPVTIISLTAKETTKGVSIAWQTASEINNSFFEVEEGSDGATFRVIGRVAGAGNSSSTKSYSLLHSAVSAGKHFYRIVTNDINGQKKYSEVVKLSISSKKQWINITPNPVTDIINLNGLSIGENRNFSITNSAGIVKQKGKLSSSAINVQTLNPGYYILTIEADGEKYTGRFIKL